MILEALVTSRDLDGSTHLAAMGPEVDGSDWRAFILRPFRTSTTFGNLQRTGQGVLHVSDDVLVLALAAIGRAPAVETRPARVVQGAVWVGACRYYEFRVAALDDREDRATIRAEVVAQGRFRDLFGLNRAKHAVVEAAILATRMDFLAMPAIADDFRRLAPLVRKTGGPDERRAFGALADFVRDRAQSRGEAGPERFEP